MMKSENNYAFIDSQNVHKGIQSLGWKIDWAKFRVYLKEKYDIKVAYLFLGFLSENQKLYEYSQRCGFVLIFKPLIYGENGVVKGNCDADLAVLKINEYDKAIIVPAMAIFIL